MEESESGFDKILRKYYGQLNVEQSFYKVVCWNVEQQLGCFCVKYKCTGSERNLWNTKICMSCCEQRKCFCGMYVFFKVLLMSQLTREVSFDLFRCLEAFYKRKGAPMPKFRI